MTDAAVPPLDLRSLIAPRSIAITVRDETFGPLMMVGAGGVLAAHHTDRAFRMRPIDEDQARAALGDLRIASVLAEERGRTYDAGGKT